jgi:hypothetical protein
MFTYKLSLYDKKSNYLIDSTLIKNCENRKIAMERVKNLLMFQGLFLSDFKIKLHKDLEK